jgi:hypothetical protein
MIYAVVGLLLLAATVTLVNKYRDPDHRAVIASVLRSRRAVVFGGSTALVLLLLDFVENGFGAGVLGGLGLAVAAALLVATTVSTRSSRANRRSK